MGNKQYNTNYLCKLLTSFEVVTEIIYGSLSTMRKILLQKPTSGVPVAEEGNVCRQLTGTTQAKVLRATWHGW
jgi:hypothetical protein